MLHFIYFLSNRTCQVRVDFSLSMVKYAESGIFQGSILNAILVSIVKLDLPQFYTSTIFVFGIVILAFFTSLRDARFR